MYTADLVSLVERYELSPHLYADDTQVYGSCSPCDVDSFLTRVSQCTCDVAEWMQSSRLRLNCDKADFAWLTTNRSIHRLPTTGPTISSVITVVLSPDTVRPGHLHRCRSNDADPGSAACFSWIRCTAPSTQHPPLSNRRPCFGRYCLCICSESTALL